MPRCTEVRFASLLSSGFITAIVVNLPERKLAKRTSVQCIFSFALAYFSLELNFLDKHTHTLLQNYFWCISIFSSFRTAKLMAQIES